MKIDSSKEKEIRPFNGMAALFLALLFIIGGTAAAVLSAVFLNETAFGIGLAAGILLFFLGAWAESYVNPLFLKTVLKNI